MGIEGIDVYHGDGAIDWPAVARSGRVFAMAKSTEGGDRVDDRFPENWRGMGSAGLLRGAYHFARPHGRTAAEIRADAEAQAEFFFGVVGALGRGDLPPTLDLETTGGLSAEGALSWALTFVARAEALFARRLIIYVGQCWKQEMGDPLVTSLSDHVLWTPRYSPVGEEPTPPRTWARWTIWQYSDDKVGTHRDGPLPRLPHDQNLWSGSLAELRALAAVLDPPAQPWPGRYLAFSDDARPQGDDVRAWQTRLHALGFAVTVDGDYGPQSRDICLRFQGERGLPADGVVGPQTWLAAFPETFLPQPTDR